jgi:hypothetical protein
MATMTAVPGSDGDGPEAYNLALFEADADGGTPIVLTRDPLASQFMGAWKPGDARADAARSPQSL